MSESNRAAAREIVDKWMDFWLRPTTDTQLITAITAAFDARDATYNLAYEAVITAWNEFRAGKDAEVAALVSALEFYAQGAPVLGFDRGNRAREALERVGAK